MQRLLSQPRHVLEAKAAKGNAAAQVILGIEYTTSSNGEAPDYVRAAEYFAAAAIAGRPDAKFNLGRCYRDGVGVAKSETRAMELFESLAANGDSGAKIQIAEMLIERERATSELVRASELLLQAGKSRNVFTKGEALFALENLDELFGLFAAGRTEIVNDVPSDDTYDAMKKVSAFVARHESFGR